MKATQELIDLVKELRDEAQDMHQRPKHRHERGWATVDSGRLAGLIAGCRLLVSKLGPWGKVWDEMLQDPKSLYSDEVEKIAAVLGTIADALAKGRLATVEELVSAEVLGDLLEHAEALLTAKYNLAAAIILRAILEERLRKLCIHHQCMPTAMRPTIETFKQALQSAHVIDKIVVKDIDWMAGVGNSAAHHLPEYKDDDVPQLYQRVTAFLSRFAVS